MNVLIVEDEKHTAQLLREIINKHPDFTVVDSLESVEEAVIYLSQHQQELELLFFDIQLADGHSFEIFKHIDVVVPVIFCTAYDEYSLQAIKNNGIDYILKPFKEEEIEKALLKYKSLRNTIKAKPVPVTIQQETGSLQQSFLSQYREKSIIIKIKDIALFAIEFETTYMYCFDGKKYPLYKTLDYVSSVCDDQLFFRVNRQIVLNRNAVTAFEPYFNRKILVHTKVQFDQKIIVSRLKVTEFKKWLQSG
ncbi:LytTR family DNA-binding domain-containing protein [Flavobacterium sp. NRK F10]|uniref:LytR/AlgR family response regulator transcription factor n=1 Tax=Flavobacterium sp. NRK F10 TaxID=2954931 RepID=UPI0020914611|nr:LytTR family DNA-binding domain-containing protein [Flavobacterium sp. NRK F10]MCO6176422.1 LytTR family DNA-binding domain-containing protein [Flavobacterium sp. NRK F10]